MSRNTKIILVVTGSLLCSCLLLCTGVAILLPRFASNVITQQPGQAQRIAAQIADFTLPPGYHEAMGLDLFVQKYVVIAPENSSGGRIVIMLMQYGTPNIDRETMEQQMQQAFQNQYQERTGQMQFVGEKTVTIKGQPTVLRISETASGRQKVRQATGVFQGRGGIVLLVLMGSASEWDDTLVDQFCRSIR